MGKGIIMRRVLCSSDASLLSALTDALLATEKKRATRRWLLVQWCVQ